MCAIIVDQSLQRNWDLPTLWRLLEVSGALARAFWSFLEALERSLEDSRAFWSFLEVSGGAGTGPNCPIKEQKLNERKYFYKSNEKVKRNC